MKSHVCEFTPKDLLRFVTRPLLPLALFAAAIHTGARLHLLPVPRPTLDAERAILIHQAEAARRPQEAEVLLLGDSSCLMNVSARQLGEQLGRPALNLATFSFLDLNAHALMLREFTRANPGRLRAVVLLMHPDSLRRLNAEPYYLAVLTNYWAGLDHCRTELPAGRASCLLGVDAFNGRVLTRIVPTPLSGAYAHRYGFTRDLESFLTREHGSAVDPDSKPFAGNAEYRLAATLERASKSFRDAVPPGAKLFVGITAVPERFAGPRYPQLHSVLLRQWSQWLQADFILTNLPPTLPDDSFARSTHLKETSIPRYTEQLAVEVLHELRAEKDAQIRARDEQIRAMEKRLVALEERRSDRAAR